MKTMSCKIKTCILLFLLLLPCCVMAEESKAIIPICDIDALQPDTIDPDDEEAYNKKAVREAQRTAQQQSALDFVLESRHRFEREDFRKHWYDHMFMEIGSGIEKFMPVPSGYEISSMVSAHANIGKTISPTTTLRLGGAWHHGSQRSTQLDFNKADAHLDYLFNISSFMYGYDPMRRVEVSALLGGGAQFTWTRKVDVVTTPMFYGGFQFKINTGAYSYIGVEPYVGITTRKADLSDAQNWRRYNVFYGVNVNLAHYFSNNWSDRQKDSIAARAPWFLEFATGAVMNKGINLSTTDSWGKSISGAVGKWFSSVFGLRVAYEVNNSSWWGETIAETETTPRYEMKHYNNQYDVRADVLLNPFGFAKKFSWESRAGMYLLGGIDFGTVRRNGYLDMDRTYTGIDFGLHLWTKLSRDLQLFIEPRYSRALLESVHKAEVGEDIYTDDAITVDLGLTMQLRMPRNRREFAEGESRVATERPWTFGFVMGLPLTQTQGTSYYDRDKFINSLSFNAMAYLKRTLGEYHSLRASVDYFSSARDVMSTYYDIRPIDTRIDGEVREGLWNRRSHLLSLALAYGFDLTKLFSGTTNDRTFQFEMFAGPAYNVYLGETETIKASEEINPGHVTLMADKMKSYDAFGILAGAQLTCNINRRLSFVCIPRLLFVHNLSMPGYKIKAYYGYVPVGGISFGLQYRL